MYFQNKIVIPKYVKYVIYSQKSTKFDILIVMSRGQMWKKYKFPHIKVLQILLQNINL